MKKKTPKRPNKRKKAKERQENVIILATFLIFIAVMAYLFYFVNTKSPNEDAVATVNGNEITKDELDWWYKTSILPQYRDTITKQDFLVLSLIPQEVLLQKAEEERIKVTQDEIERSLGFFVIENGFTLDDFEAYLDSRGITIDQIKKSFEIRAIITKLLEKEGISFTEEDENLFLNGEDRTFQEYLNTLTDDAEIEIFEEAIDKFVLRSFEETGDEVCGEEKHVIRLYTTSKCEVCEESGKVFEKLVDESVDAAHWSLDTGDDLLTPEKEKGIPKKEVDLFKKYSPNNLVPTVVLGCKYKRVGGFGAEEEDEFKAILKILAGS